MRRSLTTVVPLLAAVCATLSACSEDGGDAAAGSPVVVTRYSTGTAAPGPQPTTAWDASSEVADDAAAVDEPGDTGRQEDAGAAGLDPAYITTWGRHGGSLTLNSDGTGTYKRNSGAMNVREWMISWQGSGNTVQFVLGEQFTDLGDPYVDYSTGAQLTGTVNGDGTKMTVTGGNESMELCRSDAYDTSCGA